ncbi:uncharacterized protein LOC125260710 [Megalobrama amblycephala]|uniref:uncharacterized protein LOC125260710 n=1 Tax=Megalobrama amblycephala TaxID=75352 RepID=UPI002013C9ED|nr:uncharacterized protein LOC125260710 [Megalobrama amblycephala]
MAAERPVNVRRTSLRTSPGQLEDPTHGHGCSELFSPQKTPAQSSEDGDSDVDAKLNCILIVILICDCGSDVSLWYTFTNTGERKTCSSCFAPISQKNKVAAKKVTLDRKWGERVLKNRNAGRVVDSAHIAVKKLSALGYVPILFFGKKDKASGKWVADVVTHLPPSEDNLKIVATMRKAYNFVLIKEGNSTTTLLEPQPQFLALAESQPQAQEKETFYPLDLYPVSLPVKEQPPPPKKKKKV